MLRFDERSCRATLTATAPASAMAPLTSSLCVSFHSHCSHSIPTSPPPHHSLQHRPPTAPSVGASIPPEHTTPVGAPLEARTNVGEAWKGAPLLDEEGTVDGDAEGGGWRMAAVKNWGRVALVDPHGDPAAEVTFSQVEQAGLVRKAGGSKPTEE